MNWLKTRALCPSAINSGRLFAEELTLAESHPASSGSTSPACRLSWRNIVSDRKISKRFFSQSPNSPRTSWRSRASRVS